MRLRVLGGGGVWPVPGQACGGYLLEHDGFLVLVDPGYAVLPELLGVCTPDALDAVLVSHGHPDHCADLNPLLRTLGFRDRPASRPLPVYAAPGALDPVLALDRPGSLDTVVDVVSLTGGRTLDVGPFRVTTADLPHYVPDLGLRLEAGGASLAYPGDCGPDPATIRLADGVDVFLAEATHLVDVPQEARGLLSTPAGRADEAVRAGVGRLLLVHLFPGTDPAAATRAASAFEGPREVATPGLVLDL